MSVTQYHQIFPTLGKRSTVSGLCVIALLLASSSTGAQTASEDAMQQASVFFDRGEALFNKKQYLDAAKEFLRAYELMPNSMTLVNIGLSYEKANRPVDAMETYRRYIEDEGEKLAEDIDFVEKHMDSLRKQVSELEIECVVENCMVEVDGSKKGEAPISVFVLPGHHRVEAFADGKFLLGVDVKATAGMVAKVVLAGKNAGITSEVPALPVNAGATQEALQPLPPPPPPQELKLSAPFWGLAGTTLAAAAIATVFSVLAVNENDKFVESGRLDDDAKSTGQTDQLIANISWGVTGAAGIAAVVLFVRDVRRTKSPEAQAVSVLPLPQGGLVVGARF